MKVIALYLPQFYKVPENDYWWGEGFTDWISCKQGSSLFDDHYQPHVPYNDNYYNLLEKSTMEWQAALMREYGVDGQCFYHYWFGNNRMMLEKPAENLLKWKDINMPFCFCWANMSWARSWAKLDRMDNWIGIEDEKLSDTGKALLIEQIYGDEEEWERHFYYLLPFFNDDRYIKVEGKPVLWIYRMDLILHSSRMFAFMQELARKNGLNGIYFIGSFYQPEKRDGLDAAVIYEPGEVLPKAHYNLIGDYRIRKYDYDEYWKESIRIDYADIKTYYTGLVNYDSTVRQGTKGEVISGTPEKFEIWLRALLKKSEEKNNELIFLNAWNEWGEGNHIEPDKKYGFGYLEAIRNAKKYYKHNGSDVTVYEPLSDRTIKEINTLKYDNRRINNNLTLLEKWVRLFQSGKKLTEAALIGDKSHVAIYGYGVLGKLLEKELIRCDMNIDFIIDRNPSLSPYNIPFYSPEDGIPSTELLIITIATGYEEVIEILNSKGIDNYVLIGEIIRSL